MDEGMTRRRSRGQDVCRRVMRSAGLSREERSIRRMNMKPLKWITIITIALAITFPLSGLAKDLEPPGTVKLDKLSNLYSGVEFDHELHVDIAGDCTRCHHHTLGMAPTNKRCARCHTSGEALDKIACSDCHAAEPFSADHLKSKEESNGKYHIDIPGLKAAYHLDCLGCHKEMGGPVGCEDCHDRTELGNAFYHSGSYAPKGGKEASTH